jgi:hypothetical protein
MNFTAPKHFNINYVKEFLKEFEPTLKWKGKMVPDVLIDLSRVEQISIIGLLITYKFIDYTYNNFCFKKPNLTVSDYIQEAWDKYEFRELISAYIANRDQTEKAYKKLKIKVDDQFIIAPQALLRESDFSQTYLKNEFLPKIREYYSFNDKAVNLIFICLSEILLNFWEHAIDDTKTIILADGNRQKIEIACADTGIGIISNLSPTLPNIRKKEEILARAFEKGITSKIGTAHMGYGLWMVNELAKLNKSKLHLYSEGFFYKNDYGKVKVGKCGYWPGTIIYINLNLQNPKTISDLPAFNQFDYELNLNFT